MSVELLVAIVLGGAALLGLVMARGLGPRGDKSDHGGGDGGASGGWFGGHDGGDGGGDGGD